MFLSVSNCISRSSGQCSRRYRLATMIVARNLIGSGLVQAQFSRSRRITNVDATTIGRLQPRPFAVGVEGDRVAI